MRRVLEPDAIAHDRRPWRREKTHLRRELAALLATAQELVRERAIEKYDRFTERQTILGAAQAKHIDAGAPREVGRCAVERRHRIGKACAVELDLHSARVRYI